MDGLNPLGKKHPVGTNHGIPKVVRCPRRQLEPLSGAKKVHVRGVG